MFHQVENSNLAILLHWPLRMSQHEENSTFTITAFVSSKLNLFWLIREGSNMQKTVFLQSLRIIFEKKIHFWGITECSKHYFCISCIDHFKTNVAWIHHNIQEILLLPSLYLSSQNIIRENQVVHRSRQGINNWDFLDFGHLLP